MSIAPAGIRLSHSVCSFPSAISLRLLREFAFLAAPRILSLQIACRNRRWFNNRLLQEIVAYWRRGIYTLLIPTRQIISTFNCPTSASSEVYHFENT